MLSYISDIVNFYSIRNLVHSFPINFNILWKSFWILPAQHIPLFIQNQKVNVSFLLHKIFLIYDISRLIGCDFFQVFECFALQALAYIILYCLIRQNLHKNKHFQCHNRKRRNQKL